MFYTELPTEQALLLLLVLLMISSGYCSQMLRPMDLFVVAEHVVNQSPLQVQATHDLPGFLVGCRIKNDL
ncbi:hypothetical protein PCASD_24283 [Puccinia coronata f. sp. avenae]|uniref:Secreted protein n=1 Tax=Puccinia coronata f. sp. avenae TaxID=200324 RepID=A0A2N5TK73_9BASI|nr:hypothetical protein PCASD_24283 [Puccinia coronata f. sp. avenae]